MNHSTFTSLFTFANRHNPTHFNQLLCKLHCMQRLNFSPILKRHVFPEHKRWKTTPNIFWDRLKTSQSPLVSFVLVSIIAGFFLSLVGSSIDKFLTPYTIVQWKKLFCLLKSFVEIFYPNTLTPITCHTYLHNWHWVRMSLKLPWLNPFSLLACQHSRYFINLKSLNIKNNAQEQKQEEYEVTTMYIWFYPFYTLGQLRLDVQWQKIKI